MSPQYRRCSDSDYSFTSAGCQIGLGALANHDLQVSPQIFKWLRVQALGGPLEDIRGFVPKPVHYPGRVVRGVAGRWMFVFFEELSIFGSFRMMVPTSWRSVVAPGDSWAMSSTWFMPVEMLGLQRGEFNFCLIRSEKALFCKLQVGCHMPV